MSATGLEVFDKTLQTTNIWLDEITSVIGPDRKLAWKVLSGVLRKLRDRLSVELSAHLSAELPLLVRGTYYDQFTPARQPTEDTLETFVTDIAQWLADSRPVDPNDAIRAVFMVLSHHLPRDEIENIQNVLPKDLRVFWTAAEKANMATPKADKANRLSV
jgi:uncharacterized protein (DUF2267 family)